MTIAAIRDAAAGVLTAVSEIRSVLERPGEKAPIVVPACWFDYMGAQVLQGSRSEHKHEFALTCVVFRKGSIDRELEAIEAVITPIEQAFEQHYTLGQICEGFQLTNIKPGEVLYAGGERYVGFTMTFRPITRRPTTLDG